MALRKREISDLILFELYRLAAEPDAPDDIPPYDLSALLEIESPFAFSSRFYDLALDDLYTRGLIERSSVLPDKMSITDYGIQYIEEKLDKEDSFIKKLQESQPVWSMMVPAASRFVNLDHNKPDYSEAIESLDKLLISIKQLNFYPEENSEDKSQRIAELEAGKRLLQENRVNPFAIKGFLYGCLGYLAMKFADEPIGELARITWEAIKRLLS